MGVEEEVKERATYSFEENWLLLLCDVAHFPHRDVLVTPWLYSSPSYPYERTLIPFILFCFLFSNSVQVVHCVTPTEWIIVFRWLVLTAINTFTLFIFIYRTDDLSLLCVELNSKHFNGRFKYLEVLQTVSFFYFPCPM